MRRYLHSPSTRHHSHGGLCHSAAWLRSQPRRQPTPTPLTLQEAMASIGAADVELFGHSIGKGRSGDPPVRPTTDSPATCGTQVAEDVKQHYGWHTDDRFTVHALPDGVERITKGPNLDDPDRLRRLNS